MLKTRIRNLSEQEKRSLGESQMIADWLQIFPKGILSIVADTFDLWKLITEYLPANKKAIMDRGHIEVIKLPLFNGKPTYCGKDWAIGDTLIKIGTAHQLGYWSENDDPDDDVYQNQRTKETINLTLLNDKGSEYFKYIPGKLVIRPDSGDPVDIICGYINGIDSKGMPRPTPDNQANPKENYGAEYKGVIELLWDIFGGTINDQGYKVLDSHIGAIYGDSITPERQVQIYERLAAKGFAATNIVLGVGSFTYQYNTRDTLGFACKGAWFEVLEKKETGFQRVVKNTQGIPVDFEYEVEKKSYNIYKDPVTDDGVKRSLKGLLQVKLVDNEYIVNQECSWEQEEDSELKTIYENGIFKNQITLQDVCNNLTKF